MVNLFHRLYDIALKAFIIYTAIEINLELIGMAYFSRLAPSMPDGSLPITVIFSLLAIAVFIYSVIFIPMALKKLQDPQQRIWGIIQGCAPTFVISLYNVII